MASIFDLQILNDKYNFETNNILNKRGTKNKKKQFTEKKDLQLFLQKVESVYGHCRYIKNHIRRYCTNRRYQKSFEEYKIIIIMLSFADLKFNQQCNLFKNLRPFRVLFNEVDTEDTKMKDNYDKLVKIGDHLKNNQCDVTRINTVLTKPFLKKLNNGLIIVP